MRRYRRYTLPPAVRVAAFAPFIAAGLWLLAYAGHYGSTGRTLVLVAAGAGPVVLAVILAVIPRRPARPVVVPPWLAPAPRRPVPARVPTPHGVEPVPSEAFDDGLTELPPDGEPIPVYDDRPLVDFDDLDYAALTAGVGFDRVDLIAGPEPSDLVRQYLFPTEKFRGEWRRHSIRLLREFVVIALLALLIQSGYSARVGSYTVDTAAVPHATVVSQLALALLIGWRGLAWYNNRFVLTNKRIMLVRGILWRRVASIPLSRAASILFNRSLPGRFLGYGTFRFSGI